MLLNRLIPEIRIPLAVVLILIGVSAFTRDRTPTVDGAPATAWLEVIYAVVVIGLSMLAGALTKPDDQVRDDKPTVLATRGTFIPVIKGRQRVGYVFGWAGGRTNHTRVASGGGGKGGLLGDKPRETAYNEDGWHLVCVGEAHTLWEIDSGGVVILRGPIIRSRFPSGSTINFGNRGGDLRIFWGEITQPINTFLGDVNRVGVASRFPGLVYMEWRQLPLGTSKTWPTITYVFETAPDEAHLTHTPALIESTQIPFGPRYFGSNPIDPLTGGAADPTVDAYRYIHAFYEGVTPGLGPPDAYFAFLGHLEIGVLPESQLNGEVTLQLSGNIEPAANKDYVCDRSVYITDLSRKDGNRTRFYLKAGEPVIHGLIGTSYLHFREFRDDGGTHLIYVDGFTGGWNGGHLVASLLFDKWPNGIAQDKSRWNMDSFETFAALMATEDLRCAIKAVEGKDVRAALGGLMQDLGFTISLNPRTALLEIVPWRLPVPPLPNIPIEGMVQRPRKRLQLGHRKIDRLVFAFDDESHAFRDMTIHVDDDGQATRKEFYNQQVVAITSTGSYATAAKIAQRRSAEEMAKAHTFRVFSNRAARALTPGEAIVVEGFDEVMRITAIKFDSLSGKVELALMNDFYGTTINDYITPPGKQGGPAGGLDPAGPTSIFLEVPEAIAGPIQTAILFTIRSNKGVTSQDVYISSDGSSYDTVGPDPTIVTGGRLLEEDVPLDGEWLLDEGPTFEVVGQDIGDVLDLSADLASWRAGRQLAIWVDANGVQEICYLQKVTFITGSLYRLDGLIRARYDADPVFIDRDDMHAVIIVQNDEGLPIRDTRLQPGVTVYGKGVPTGVSPALVVPVTLDLYGRGKRPLPVKNVRLKQGSEAVGSGNTDWTDFTYKVNGSAPADDLIFIWSYKTPRSNGTGAGEFAAGNIQLDPPPEGDFVVEILDSSDVLQRTTSTATPTYTYTRADRIADFTSEPTSFKVRVTQTRGGYLADTTTQTISKR